MKKILFIVIALLYCLNTNGQTTRYFEFITTDCNYGNWQDTSFIASTTKNSVIEKLIEDMNKPLDQRRFISGAISYGDGGFMELVVGLEE